MRAVCLQHVPFEGPGAFATALAARGTTIDRYLVPKDGLPNDAGDLLIVMGGPMSVNDPDGWIADETDFIRTVLLAGKAVIGVCLGSQFMAKALGATVRPGKGLEIGMAQITLTPEAKQDPVFGCMPDSFDVFEWHGEVFNLPKDCVPLAGSAIAPLQAFRYGTRAYGLLFHLEIEERGIQALCRHCPNDLSRAKLNPLILMRQAEPHLSSLHRWAAALISHVFPS